MGNPESDDVRKRHRRTQAGVLEEAAGGERRGHRGRLKDRGAREIMADGGPVVQADMRGVVQRIEQADIKSHAPIRGAHELAAIRALRRQAQPCAGIGSNRDDAKRAQIEGVIAHDVSVLDVDPAAHRKGIRQPEGNGGIDVDCLQRDLLHLIAADPVVGVGIGLAKGNKEAQACGDAI